MAGYNKSIFTKGTATYKDFDMSFKVNPYTGDIRMKEDVDAIKQALTNLIFTNFGERPFRPLLAGGLGKLLFEPLDRITINRLDNALRTMIANWEPRVEVLEVSFKDKADDNALEITFSFNVINISQPQTLSVILRRTR